jgi:hypothetical protein
MARAAALPAVVERKSGPGSRSCAGRGEEGRGSAATDGGEGGLLGRLDRRRREMKDAVAGRTVMRAKQASAALVVLVNAGAGRGAGAGERRPGGEPTGQSWLPPPLATGRRRDRRGWISRRRAGGIVSATSSPASSCDELEGPPRPAAGARTPQARPHTARVPARWPSMALAAAGPGKGHQDCQDEGGSPSRTREEDGGARGRGVPPPACARGAGESVGRWGRGGERGEGERKCWPYSAIKRPSHCLPNTA